MTEAPQKILVCGDVCGEIDQLFKRVKSVNKKVGPFDLLLCTGDFFNEGENPQWLPYKRGLIKVPVCMFVLGPRLPEHEKHFADPRGGELAENVIHLGPSGIYPCSSGLRIAYLSGSEKTSQLKQGYTNSKVGQLEAESRQLGVIDILLAHQWPSHISTFATKPPGSDVTGCPLVARLAHSIKPRYHFAASHQLYYERLPYRNHQVLQEGPRQCSRFLGLCRVGGGSKWLYAFTISPATHCPLEDLTAQPPDVTESPYLHQALPPVTDVCVRDKQSDQEINQFFYGGGKHEQRGKKRKDTKQCGGREKRPPPPPTGPCWFCLSSPEVERHLIVSVGEHTYLSLAKGGLVPHHMLICPILHYQTSLDLEQQAIDELRRFQSAVTAYFASRGECVVFYERNYRTTHMQLHAVPLPRGKADQIAHVFKCEGDSHGTPLEELPPHTELSAAVRSGQPYLLVQPPEGPRLLARVSKGYNMRFDREVLASPSLLDLPDRVDWKNCTSDRTRETEDRDKIRADFAPHDFIVEEGSDGSDSGEV